MNYSKPKVNTLGQAKRVIESNLQMKTPKVVFDGIPHNANPAYDLDE